jgi:hypothetical protein
MQFGHLPNASSVGSPKSPYAIPKTGRDEILRQSMIDLNPTFGEAVEDRFHRLQHQDISSILMLGSRFGANQPSERQILLVSAPMLAPVGDIKDPASRVVYSEAWSESFLACLPQEFPVDTAKASLRFPRWQSTPAS